MPTMPVHPFDPGFRCNVAEVYEEIEQKWVELLADSTALADQLQQLADSGVGLGTVIQTVGVLTLPPHHVTRLDAAPAPIRDAALDAAIGAARAGMAIELGLYEVPDLTVGAARVTFWRDLPEPPDAVCQIDVPVPRLPDAPPP
jgi:hypothetical protein